MRSGLVAAIAAFSLAACGQGGQLGAGSSGWQLQEVRDELTGRATQTALRSAQVDNGHVEIAASCGGEQVILTYDEWGEVGPAGTGQVVDFRLTFIATGDQSFAMANAGTALGLQSTIPLRASAQEGQEERLVGLVDHQNSLTTQIPVATFVSANAITALRVEVPLLLQSASSGQPPVSQNVVVDLMPSDANLRQLASACDPTASRSVENSTPPTPSTTTQSASFTLGSVPDGAMASGAGCVAVNASGVNVFMTDYSTGAISLNGETVQLAIRGQGDVGRGGEFYDFSGRINVRIALTGEPSEAGEELSSAPANLTLTVDGVESVVPIDYRCGS